MSIRKTIGGDRLGSGKRMKVDLHGYERSTHNLGYLWRSTLSAGTLVPCIKELALPGDTFDIELAMELMTHPTVGPLFGSYKAQLDVFFAPLRLYQGQLHNNKLGIGMNMAQVKLPVIEMYVDPTVQLTAVENVDNAQVNPSCIHAYLGLRGIGQASPELVGLQERTFNAVPLLAYYDIYKNYYANKQEENAYIIHKPGLALIETVDSIIITLPTGNETIQSYDPTNIPVEIDGGPWAIEVGYTGATPDLEQIILVTNEGNRTLDSLMTIASSTLGFINGNWTSGAKLWVYGWKYAEAGDVIDEEPQLVAFPLTDIDRMRESILSQTELSTAYNVTDESILENIEPYRMVLEWTNGKSPYTNNQEGLAIKTYQSDLFNNWLNTEWIDGTNGIAEITAIDTSGGSFSLDTLNLSKKVYDMLNRIAISGGSYNDWLEVNYDHQSFQKAESPIYYGGLIRELVFQEVISNSEASGAEGSQPLGTLAGKGILSQKKKGGSVTIKVDEPGYIIGIISLTPRVDYSQGNKWDVHLKTMDDLHKPALDEIGFQDLITEQMAWWDTKKEATDEEFKQYAAGKQPAWINYMTNVNQTYGNFAIADNEMFMTLNRRYEKDNLTGTIKDLTSYIDPVKFNNSFAQTAIDAQNFWAQIAVDITARRKMSAKIMPNI